MPDDYLKLLAMARHVPSSVWQLGARAMGA